MLIILKHFNMSFLGDNWEENISLQEMGIDILSDTKRKDIFPFLPNYLKENYPKLFTFEEAEKIYKMLMNIENEFIIAKLCEAIPCNSLYAPIAKKRLDYYEEQIEKGKFEEKLSFETKSYYASGFNKMALELLESLYKLAMKSYN